MIIPDVNVLIYSFREEMPNYAAYRSWLLAVLTGDAAFGVSDLVLSSVVRVLTHPRIFAPPTPLEIALEFVARIREAENAVSIIPGPRHWDIFVRLCGESNAKGNLVADAYLAAMAIEAGCEWVTTDRDFSRFPGLRWRQPLAASG